MLNLNFEIDEEGFDRSAETFERQTIVPSLVGAVNRAAARVARGLGGFLAENLHKASPFTLQAGGYLEAEPDDPAPAALVFVRRRQASYLGYEVFGGTRAAGDPETLPGGVLVPMRDSVMDANDNLDLETASAEMAAPDTRWLALGPPGDQVLVRGNGTHLVFLVGLTPETHYDAELDLYGWLARESERAVADELQAAVVEWDGP